jgi:hypothetical protein
VKSSTKKKAKATPISPTIAAMMKVHFGPRLSRIGVKAWVLYKRPKIRY